VYTFHNWRIDGRKLIKFGVDVMPYVTIGNIIFNFVLSTNPTRQLLEIVRWNDNDYTTNDPPRMPSLTSPFRAELNLFKSDAHVYRFHERIAGRKLKKFGVDVMPYVTTAISDFLTSYSR
jgi:hypothetical protein